jgi:dipeptidyl aminopeptidase/acylaminoacyl peptidase
MSEALTGYGRAFEEANRRDLGGGDLKDLEVLTGYFGAGAMVVDFTW